jgi:hypothetical protein
MGKRQTGLTSVIRMRYSEPAGVTVQRGWCRKEGMSVIETALLREALRGATRSELSLAARAVAARASQAEIDRVLEELESGGYLSVRGRWWTTTPRGRRRITREEPGDKEPAAGGRKRPR